MHKMLSGWPRLRNLFLIFSLCILPRKRLEITVFEQVKILTKAAALILTVAGTTE